MKLWTFYLKSDTLNKEGVYENDYDLKAFTNNKEYALQFSEIRDISNFIVRKHKVTKEEYVEFANEHRGRKLDVYKLNIRKPGTHTEENTIEVDMLLTYDEHMYIEDPAFIIEDPSFWNCAPFPYIFKDKYFNALSCIQYVALFKFIKDIFNLPPVYTKFIDDDEDDYSYNAPEFVLDPISLLLDVSDNNF